VICRSADGDPLRAADVHDRIADLNDFVVVMGEEIAMALRASSSPRQKSLIVSRSTPTSSSSPDTAGLWRWARHIRLAAAPRKHRRA
jgi:hypothetical protein